MMAALDRHTSHRHHVPNGWDDALEPASGAVVEFENAAAPNGLVSALLPRSIRRR